MFRWVWITLALTVATPAAAEIVVNYDALAASPDPALRRDIERKGVIHELSSEFDRLDKRYIRPGQVLHIQIQRLDLAGEYEPWRRGFEDVRIMRDITPPRINLHYALFENGRKTREGTARLSDMNYLSDPRARSSDERLIHEKLLLRDWFRETFR
ncbi:DUF3016 domain-containing protein [Paracoccus aestuariivivens]|nr:DUF3016 domain-containing protein [Paracoccus aestuariivivens]